MKNSRLFTKTALKLLLNAKYFSWAAAAMAWLKRKSVNKQSNVSEAGALTQRFSNGAPQG